MPRFTIAPLPDTYRMLEEFRKLARGIVKDAEVEKEVRTLVELALEEAKAATPGSGKLRGMWQITRTEKHGWIRFNINNKADDTLPKDKKGGNLLSYLEFGTKPHYIFAKNAKALRFMMNNRAVYAKWVAHPGTRPYGMVRAASTKVKQQLDGLMESIKRRIVNRVNAFKSNTP